MFEPLSRQSMHEADALERGVLDAWTREDLFQRILDAREGAEPFVFYEGPPTANGKPGIHHVLARTLKDSVCRFYTMRGRSIRRKAGWDTHGLPVELEVEKELGINGKPEIEEYGIQRFNEACRNSVFTYKEEWEQLSQRIGYLLDYDAPYVTYHKEYVESVWFLLSRFAANDLLYRGYKVLPWCGRCGTGLSSHEVGQGYKDIDDPSVWISFPLKDAPGDAEGAALVAWTTTPWTLPSNLSACVHPDFEYAVVETDTGKYVLLEKKADEVFGEDAYKVVGRVRGRDLAGLSYEPLFELDGMVELREGARRHEVVADDFVTDEDGTGIVHLAPYGADDFRIAQELGFSVRLAVGDDAKLVTDVGDVEKGTFFKDADKALMKDLKQRGRLVKRAQYKHSYPHCWRCDTPLLYFPAPAWFLRTTAYKDRMVEENARITWAPPEIGTGRFGEWLAGNIDWALSRDRYWGTPLPVWSCDADESHWECLESFAQLGERVGGLPDDFDPHRPYVDEPSYACREPGCGGTMRRVPQVIDAWFDSGSMPFAQYHWPFENQELVQEQFPASFICEGLDQTRGWFYTLHAIATFLTTVDEKLWKERPDLPRLTAGSAYQSCMVNGLLLDAEGRKMSKRLGNRVDPNEAIAKHGVDAIRWSMLSGGATHLSRRYSDDGISEVRRRVLGTLTQSYDFLGLYAGTEGWTPDAPRPAREARPAIDRWILSRTATTAAECIAAWEALDPSSALRALEALIVDQLSNWYIRRSRRRFWNGDDPEDQRAAFATLDEVLRAIARMAAPAAPFVADALWRRLTQSDASVHLEAFPDATEATETSLAGAVDDALDHAMQPVLTAATLGRSVRTRTSLRTRQPLRRMLIHVVGESELARSPRDFEDSLREELNVKEIEWIDGVPEFLEVKAKPNFKTLGKRAGKDMKALAAEITAMDRATLFRIQGGDVVAFEVGGNTYEIGSDDVSVETLSVEGLEAATDGTVTIGLETELDDDLVREGIAREIVNRVQNQRKDMELDVSDRIRMRVSGDATLQPVLEEHGAWIREGVLATELTWVDDASSEDFREWELPDDMKLRVAIEKAS